MAKPIVVTGGQWGDEGKGKVVSWLARKVDVVVRFNGGANAGHTVVIGGKTIKLHILPTGVVYEHTLNVIAPGVVFDPVQFVREVREIRKTIGVPPKVFVSPKVPLVLPVHKEVDGLLEAGERKIGSTKRGIGPAVADKVSRIGLRLEDGFKGDFRDRVRKAWEKAGLPPEKGVLDEFLSSVEEVKKYVADTTSLLYDAFSEGKRILFEGAQGTLLDIDFGTYPYVTSTNTVAPYAPVGAGAGFIKDFARIGVFKAYTTRVGLGPFPTEEKGRKGELLREIGREYGATTGRPRRCGWFDVPLARYALLVNGYDWIILTKVDVLEKVLPAKVCVAYRIGDRKVDVWKGENLNEVEPVYEEVEDWREEKGLLERLLGVNVIAASCGPAPDDIIVFEDILKGLGW